MSVATQKLSYKASCKTPLFFVMLDSLSSKVDASYSGSLLWQNDVFSMSTLYSKACGD
jgi:hypothetical protein